MTVRCDLTDLLVDQCGHCTGAEKRLEKESAEPGVYGPWITAGHPGMCSGCWEDIKAGDQIRADGDGCWLCAECGSAP
jgi:hypothetical protein